MTKGQTFLISAFVIRLLESITFCLATWEILIILLVSVAKQAGLSIVIPDSSKTGFRATRLFEKLSRTS